MPTNEVTAERNGSSGGGLEGPEWRRVEPKLKPEQSVEAERNVEKAAEDVAASSPASGNGISGDGAPETTEGASESGEAVQVHDLLRSLIDVGFRVEPVSQPTETAGSDDQDDA